MIRLITDKSIIYFTINNKELIPQQTSIATMPEGEALVVGFCSSEYDKELAKEVGDYISKGFGIVYVCDKLPKNPLIDKRVVYIETGGMWFTHLLFFNPLIFRGYFSKGRGGIKIGKQFSSFIDYKIPEVENIKEYKDNILLEVIGGVGDCLMTTPSINYLHTYQNKKVSILCNRARVDCFRNLDFIEKIYTHKESINSGNFEKIVILDFGNVLNRYDMILNQQNRTYAIANLCGIKSIDLNKDFPIINLSEEEIKKYSDLNNKNTIFFGYDSARSNNKIPLELAQNIINKFTEAGLLVVTSTLKNRGLKNCIDYSEKTNIRDLFSLIYNCDYVFTLDSSYLHISQAFRKKTFALMNYFPRELRIVDMQTIVYEPENLKCYPCWSAQRVSSKDMQCHNKSCFYYFNWNKIISDILYKLNK